MKSTGLTAVFSIVLKANPSRLLGSRCAASSCAH